MSGCGGLIGFLRKEAHSLSDLSFMSRPGGQKRRPLPTISPDEELAFSCGSTAKK
jgi:hypothetical protein